MFNWAILLQKTCTNFGQEDQDVQPYDQLLEIEWDQARNITALLESLSSATNILFASKYPTLNKALPVYILLMSQLH
jgi:hypothetical protein